MIVVQTSLSEQDADAVKRIADELTIPQAAALRLIIRRGVESIGPSASRAVRVAEVQSSSKEPVPVVRRPQSVQYPTVRLCVPGYCARHAETGAAPCLKNVCYHGGTPWLP
jgi:hypothetical protein